MAEAFFNILSKGKAVATSAGTEPAQQLNPTVVQAMLVAMTSGSSSRGPPGKRNPVRETETSIVNLQEVQFDTEK